MSHMNKSLGDVNNYDELMRAAGCRVPDGDKGRQYAQSFKDGLVNSLKKSFSESNVLDFASGQFDFNLDEQIKHLYPVQTPALNDGLIGDKGGQVGQDRTYIGIAKINTAEDSGAAANASDSDDGRGALNNEASFKLTRAINNKLMPEFAVDRVLSQMSGKVNAYAAKLITSLATAKKGLEQNLLFSKYGALGAVTGVLGTAHSGGSLADGTYTVYVSALNYWGTRYFESGLTSISALVGGTTRYGESTADSDNSATTATTNNSVEVTWDYLPGAFAYNVYAKKDSGTVYWLGTAHSSRFRINTLVGGIAATAPTADGSAKDLKGATVGYDGMYSQMLVNGTYADIHARTYRPTAATALSAVDGGCGIQEFEDLFERAWAIEGVGYDYMLVNGQDWGTVISPLLASSSTPNYQLMVPTGEKDTLTAGVIIDAIKNQYSGKPIKRLIHPLMPRGKVMFYTKDLPYDNNNVGVNSTHFYNELARQIELKGDRGDFAPPGRWGISTIGQQFLAWPNACGLIENFLTTEGN